MAVTIVLSEIQRAALQALCDTIVPALLGGERLPGPGLRPAPEQAPKRIALTHPDGRPGRARRRRGELHDTPGVWVGDASAFPTSTGTDPMATVMALAHRTAAAIVA
jgi:choline dehydrogenase-like flavoprotein